MKNLLKKTLALFVIGVFLSQVTTVAHASWGLERLQQQQNQSTTTPSQSQKKPTTADKIRSLRSGQPISENESVSKPSQTQSTASSNTQANMSSLESQMLELINKERQNHGLKPLQWHSKLADLAKLKSEDIIKNNYFSHTSPTYGSFYQMVQQGGVSFRQVGENLAKAKDVQKAHVLLMASEGHRNNILNPSFTHIGLGISKEQYGIVVTQLFIQ